MDSTGWPELDEAADSTGMGGAGKSWPELSNEDIERFLAQERESCESTTTSLCGPELSKGFLNELPQDLVQAIYDKLYEDSLIYGESWMKFDKDKVEIDLYNFNFESDGRGACLLTVKLARGEIKRLCISCHYIQESEFKSYEWAEILPDVAFAHLEHSLGGPSAMPPIAMDYGDYFKPMSSRKRKLKEFKSSRLTAAAVH